MPELTPGSLTHLNAAGEARMVDVSAKPEQVRTASAEGRILMQPATALLLQSSGLPKGDVIACARLAGIMAAKETQRLIPLCHQIPLASVTVDFLVGERGVHITATTRTNARTGVEMEALTAVSVAALTIYDMCKAVDRTMSITDISVTRKSKE